MNPDNSSAEYVPLIKEVSIENFKGLKHCEIKDVGKVNLFIGRNSCGKSSIMEAIYFAGKEFIGTYLVQCIRRRANRAIWSGRELWYGYDLSSIVSVRLTFSEQNFTEMKIRFSSENERVAVHLRSGSADRTSAEELLCQYDLSNFNLRTGRTPKASRIASPNSEQIRQYFHSSVFVDPGIKTNVRQIEGSYLNVVKLSEDSSSDLAKRTAEVYETKPSWEFLPHPDFSPDTPSRFAILEGKRRLFFDNFGDGLHYGLAIMAVAKTRKNTALFIEEIESHQHPEAIKNLISNLLDIARINNLQLFITTHNPYVHNYLYYHYKSPEEKRKEFRCFHVTRDKDSGEVKARTQEGILNIYEDIFKRPQ